MQAMRCLVVDHDGGCDARVMHSNIQKWYKHTEQNFDVAEWTVARQKE